MKTRRYTQAELNAEKCMAMEVAKEHGTSARIGESGRCTMNIPRKAYFNAIMTEGGVIDGKTVWSDPGYRKDMKKRHPFLEVKAAEAGGRVGPLLRRGPKTADHLFKGKFDDVEGDPAAFINSQRGLVT